MLKEEKELLLKDLCARLPYGVMVQDELGRINKLVIGNADLVRLYYNDFSIYGENALSLPFLRPLSSMTDEEKKEFFQLMGNGTDIQRIDFYLSHYFDFRCLIPMGLALEAPTDMYI